MILSNNAVKSLSTVANTKAKEFVVDSSNSFYRADKLLREAESHKIKIFSVLHHGAFDLTI
jgi:competence protein ComEC